MTKMRPPNPGEPWLSRFVLRPVVWAAFQFSSEARFIRKHRRRAEGGIIPPRRPTDDTVPVFLSEGGPVTSQEQADALGLGQAYRRLNDERRPQPEG